MAIIIIDHLNMWQREEDITILLLVNMHPLMLRYKCKSLFCQVKGWSNLLNILKVKSSLKPLMKISQKFYRFGK